LAAVGFFLLPFGARADHWWNGSFHWASTPQVPVVIGDNLSSEWTAYLDEAIADWNDAPEDLDVMDVTWAPGGTSPKNCRPTEGRVEICSAKYGDTGWLGITQAWLENHDGHVHITQATIRLNDSYFGAPPYNTSDWRELAICHETGHTLGLGHRDETLGGDPLGTCLDYTNDPTLNTDPDEHDYYQLWWIYAYFFDPLTPHPTESSDGGGGGGRGGGRGQFRVDSGTASGWGRIAAEHGRESAFEADLGGGRRLLTLVLWMD
jgi:hypothetical protein